MHRSNALQHPGHEAASPQEHAPPLHVSPALHGPHAAPALPHIPSLCADGRTQAPDEQQPVAQTALSQTHWPTELQSSEPQLVHAAPPVPHDDGVCVSKSSH
jgi:hypothetical protein